MSSKTKEMLESQKEYHQKAILERNTLLKARGLEDSVIRKDTILKSLNGKLKQIQKRLATISDIKKRYESLALRKKEIVVAEPEKKRSVKKTKRDVINDQVVEQDRPEEVTP
jgi:hypothetical protein